MDDAPAGISEARFGAAVSDGGLRFSVWSGSAERIWVCLFDETERETDRIELERSEGGVHSVFVPGLVAGQRYGLRADGPYQPGKGLWFDPSKLLTDPYALTLDWSYRYNPLMAAPRWQRVDTAAAMPKALVTAPAVLERSPPKFETGGLIYELNVRGFTIRHPDVRPELRGTLSALREPAIIDHLQKLHVAAVELMPITAWIDERHLRPLALSNAWGYNPVSFMALDPRLAPGGWAELRDTVATLHEAGIGTILDLVFNHTGESDVEGPTLSLRGLDALAYYRHDAEGNLVNDTGTGNTLDCGHPIVRRLVLDSLRAFVNHAGVDGFRFDLATILGRTAEGFRPDAPLLQEIASDPVLSDRILIAEPWDIGPGGYQLGNFPERFLEWNDRYRDDVRRFWRGDPGTAGDLATRLAGSSDVFGRNGARLTRTVNFVAAHDGMTLADICAYEHKHNEANGEDNRDGHDENLSWNNGVEGGTLDDEVRARRGRDIRALLATLFMSRGTIMLTAGDEFGRTQKGNNNAYAQDNELTWLDWAGRDLELESFTNALAAIRESAPAFASVEFFSGVAPDGAVPDVAWLDETGNMLGVEQWTDRSRRRLTMLLAGANGEGGRLAVMINGDENSLSFALPLREEFRWKLLLPDQPEKGGYEQESWEIAGCTVALAVEEGAG